MAWKLMILFSMNIDVVITDIRMPILNRLDYEKLKIDSNITFIVFIWLWKFEYARAMKNGIKHYLLK